MITTTDSLRKRISRAARFTAYLMLGATISATLAVADDPPGSNPPAAVSSSPPAQFRPMTPSERLHNYLVGLAGYQPILEAAASAGINQANHTPKEWGEGAEGYGQRFGNAYAQNVIHRTLQYGIAAALHEDNRYVLSGQTGFFQRTKYAVVSTLLARHDNGNQALSVSRIGSAAGSAFISRAWQPRSTTSAGDGAVSFGITLGVDAGFNVLREFWPDVKRRIRKK
jgi:hypothetical protein